MTNISQTQVAIIGGGLAGLPAAHLLHRAGVSFQLFEARDRLGGRILTVFERLLLWREPPSATLTQMSEATYLPWAEQMRRVFK